jgi:hypothetical protein
MEKKNDNSGRERGGEFCGGAGEVNSNVKGVGQECPTHTSLIDLQAVAEDNCKRMGEAVEAAFLARVCKLRIPVCKPGETANGMTLWWIGEGFWRVQVKGGSYCEGSKYQAGAGGQGKPFTKEDMDFVVVHVVPLDVWYVIPIEQAEGLVKLWFNPRSTRARFEKYREGWCLLDCPRKGRGRGDMPGRCRSEAVKVRCAVCPLRGQRGS